MMTDEVVELKPCPFCGGGNVSVSGPHGWHQQWCITHSCPTFYSGAQELAQGFPSKAEAIAAWNTRAPLPTPSLQSEDAVEPIPMLLYCPQCGYQHVDEPDERTPGWTNPPHRSHLCHDCGCIWRPADVPTNGVAAIETQGKADTWTSERGNAERASLQTIPEVTGDTQP